MGVAQPYHAQKLNPLKEVQGVQFKSRLFQLHAKGVIFWNFVPNIHSNKGFLVSI